MRGKNVAIPLTQAGQVTDLRSPALNVTETYSVDVVRGDRRSGARASVTNAAGGSKVFDKPVDNIGTKTIPDYAGYAAKHVYSVNVPGCNMPAKMFVGQRKEAFAVNLGTIFDLVNAPVAVITDPALINAAPNTIDDANVTSLALEVHKSCLTQGSEPVIGAWTTASLRQGSLLDPTPKKGHQTTAVSGGAWTQVSRLGMPLVNEVVIGLPDKDRFNGSKPKDDGQFADYVTNPTLPALLEIALGLPITAPTNFPRTDLVTTFLTGIPGVNQPANVVASEELRLNTGIAAVPFAQQNRLGIVGSVRFRAPRQRYCRPNAALARCRWVPRRPHCTMRWIRRRSRSAIRSRTSRSRCLAPARTEGSIMTKQSIFLGSCVALLLSACGGGGGGDSTPPVTEAVPSAAATDSEAATQYLVQLTETAPASTDRIEPIAELPDKLAIDDTSEPRAAP
jgi:hypothetical protein